MTEKPSFFSQQRGHLDGTAHDSRPIMLERFEEAAKELRINEIRTERLSRALREVARKQSSTIAVSKISDPFPGYYIDEECEKERSHVIALNSSRRAQLMRAHSGSTIDDVDSLFRLRDSSISRLNQFRSVRIPAISSKLEECSAGKEEAVRKSSSRMQSFNRFIRHFMPTYSSVDGHPRKDQSRYRASTITAYHRDQLRVPKSPSPTPRLRADTESASKSDAKNRRITSNHRTSKSTSSTGSSRSLSPNPGGPISLTAGMLGCITSEQQHMPHGNRRSSSYVDGSFTTLVIGSTGVGKTALINRFLQEDLKRTSPRYEADYLVDDYTVTVIADGEESELRFIEVNNQKSDLWLSLSGAAFVVLYNFDDTCSFHNAADVIARLRERADTATKPILLVSNKQTLERKRFVIANDDGRQVAKRNNCSFYEVYIRAGRSALDLLMGITLEVRRYYLEPKSEQLKLNDGVTPDEDISPPLFDYASSAAASLGIGFLQARSSLAPTLSATNRTSSVAAFGQKLWPRKKVKASKSADSPDIVIRKPKNPSPVYGLHNCFLGMRRGSRSLEALHVRTK